MSIHLVSDDLIDSGATLYATEHDYASIEQAYERGAKSLRDIYEAELQSMRERLSRMEAALRRAQESMYYAKEKGIGIGGTGYIDEALSNK